MTANPSASPAGRGEAAPAVGRRRVWGRLRSAAAALAVVAIASAAGWLAYDRYRVEWLADAVREAFATRRYAEARPLLAAWVERRPRSGEAQYYRAWLALVDDRPTAAADAVRRAYAAGFDRGALEIVQAIYQARGGRFDDAEPVLRAAFARGREPQAEVACELARLYLATYRLTQAERAVERYRELMPLDPRPYLWLNEIGGRTGAQPAALIHNYRAALERDPGLDKARLGLAEQLSKDRRYDEAEEEYRAYLARHPRDAGVLVGLGRNAFLAGDVEGAVRAYESALQADPRQADAVKELAQLDIRSGRFRQAVRRLEDLLRIDPFDHEGRYSYAQALKLAGEPEKARVEAERAGRIREEQDRIVRLRSKILNDPTDVTSRYELARWMLTHGHAEEGLDWAKEILRTQPRHGPTHRMLAEYYAAHGNPGLANYHRAMVAEEQGGP